MAIVAFWNDGAKETGQTVAISAIGTYLSFFCNYKVLILNTKHNSTTFNECFWSQVADKVNFKDTSKTDIASGTSGLAQAILSNKTSPEIITNYTKVIFKDKLEVLTDKESSDEEYNKQKNLFKEMAKMANKAYDIVLVDITGDIKESFVSGMLETANLIVLTLPQSLRGLNKYIELRKENEFLSKDKKTIMIGRYDKYSKYNIKNIERHIGEREIYGIPYNTLFFESCNEGQVADYFIKLRKIKETDPNSPFVESVKAISEGIVERIKRMQEQLYSG